MYSNFDKSVFDKKEWEERLSFYNNISAVINDPNSHMQHSEGAQLALEHLIKKDPRLIYYDYRIRNPKKEGYYRKRLEQFIADSESDDEDDDEPPNKYLFEIEKEFIKDMKIRFYDQHGYCWNYINIVCRKYPCDKTHIFYEIPRKQILEYFDLFI